MMLMRKLNKGICEFNEVEEPGYNLKATKYIERDGN
jgi:hypothetical protein